MPDSKNTQTSADERSREFVPIQTQGAQGAQQGTQASQNRVSDQERNQAQMRHHLGADDGQERQRQQKQNSGQDDSSKSNNDQSK